MKTGFVDDVYQRLLSDRRVTQNGGAVGGKVDVDLNNAVGTAQRDGETLTCPVTFRVTMQAPEDIGIYRILLSASAQSPADLFPTDLEPWVDEWDISVAAELTWLNDPESFDGSKTLYLKRIMNQLVVSSNTVQTTGENALSPTHELVRFYVDLYVDEQGYFRTE